MKTAEQIESENRAATIQAMHARGGMFVKALASAAAAADKNNYYRLKQAFPEIWENYAPKNDR